MKIFYVPASNCQNKTANAKEAKSKALILMVYLKICCTELVLL